MVKKIRPVLQKHKPFKRALIWSVSLSLSFVLVGFFFVYLFPLLPFRAGPIAQLQAYAYSSKKIVNLALFRKDTQVPGEDASTIVRTIVDARTKETFLYTGGHYTDFYIRNLGTFANTLVEPGAAETAEEWLARVDLLTRSTELALDVFADYNQITTTIVELEQTGKYVPINIYVEPSDSLPSLLRMLHQLTELEYAQTQFAVSEEEAARIKEYVARAHNAIAKHKLFLIQQGDLYVQRLVDKDGLIRTDVELSGIKDAWVRHSSLYDNVMLWGLYYYGAELGLRPEWELKADDVKRALLSTYWDKDLGIFYDERPSFVKRSNYFSADNIITYDFGMLSTGDADDRYYLEQIVTYIQQKQLDKPFPLKTTEVRIPEKEHIPVRLFAPNYIGTTIWSYWGMVYINLIDDLSTYDGNGDYHQMARDYLDAYTQKIEYYQGFPELYHPNGEQYRLPLYRSVNDMVWGIYYLYLENKLSEGLE